MTISVEAPIFDHIVKETYEQAGYDVPDIPDRLQHLTIYVETRALTPKRKPVILRETLVRWEKPEDTATD